MTKNKTLLGLLLLIIIIASFLRLYNITLLPPGLYPDEAMNGNNALEALSPNGNFKIFYPENNGREGLFIDIQAISIAIFGNTPWALRGVSAIFGILTVLGVYFLTRELFDEQPNTDNRQPTTNLKTSEIIALLSSFLIATSFWHINFSRIGFRAITAPFYLTFALYFLLKAWRNKSYKWMALAGFVFGLGLHSYIAYRATPIIALIIFIYWFFKFKAERIALIKRFVIFVISAVISASPLLYYFVKNPQDFFGRTSQISVFSSLTPLKDLTLNILKTVGMFNFVGDQNWRHNFAGRPELFWPVGIMFIVGIVIGIYYLFKKKDTNEKTFISGERLPFIILFSWMVIASLPIVISNEGLPHSLRAIIMIPPVFILAGFGGVWIYQWATKYEIFTKIRKVLIPLLILLLFTEAYYTYFINWGMNQNTPGAFAQNYVDIGKVLNSQELKDYHKYVVVKAGGALVRGIPMPSQTVMYITDTFTPEKQNKKDMHYVLSEDLIPKNTKNYIVFIE
ncbi:hypothetical protein COV23_01935 [Candidatus Wolfebacteria bacterium CG10_big_fil_rev_8_21_14_0_10_31_9]|uniref:Glycosyltransferase RgtA/B/C/D-like domain-containing protein n=1 Tax=Candidatus Wolfebacteria bacterium CG10_big_fil_rev_8_21_14_0_10_31_9 TaxID=1975070 RepID=A0A2H0RC47_9BACT|nr:MAG: hypothetical protein COV23_01935 [Candidatus Wolfebacteria bacterium CG10_big_fil_rev_8_21_14_0_10_31_9]